jgi:hypothetical protein
MTTPYRLTDRVLLCLDPGLTSGVAQISLHGETPVLDYSAELSVDETEDWLVERIYALNKLRETAWVPHIEVVAETFIITTETAKKTQSPWSLRLLGSTHFIARTYGHSDVVWAEQRPSDAKALVSNDILRAAEMWHRGGGGHANDAIRHGIYRLITTGWSGEGVLPV